MSRYLNLLGLSTILETMQFKAHSGRIKGEEVNTPGNFIKCPKGAKEFEFKYLVANNEFKVFKCFARTQEKADKKFNAFYLSLVIEV